MISVLYVDDEPDLLALGKIFLEKTGDFSVTTVSSARDALDMMLSRHFDLVLSDYQMPEMDGITLLKEVRSRYVNLPLILFTGRGREEIVIEAINNGADFYLQKGGEPLAQFTELIHKIQIAVGRRHAMDELRAAYEQITAQEEELRGQYDEMVSLQTRTLESQQMLQQVLNAVPARVFWKDTNLRYLGSNEPFARDAGFSAPADLIGKTDFEMGWREQAELYRADDRKLIETGIPKIGYEEPQTTPEGNLWLRTNKSPLRDTRGAIIGVLGTYEDITQRRAGEEELRAAYGQLVAGQQVLQESEERYRTVLENIQDAFYRTDLEGNFVMGSPSILKTLGYESFDILLNKPIADTLYYQPEKRGEFLRALAEKGYVENYEVQLKRKDGSPVWVSTNSHYYRAPEGSIAGIEGMFRDISRRKEIEAGLSAAHKKITAQSRELKLRLEELEKASQALVRNEKDFESMVECAPDAIYLSDSERFVYANTAFARMLGATSPDQLIGMPVYDRIHPDCHALVRERANQIHGEGKPSGLKDVVYLKMDSTPVNVETSAAPFRFRGQTAGLVILRDISVRKQAQDELRLASLHAEEAAKLAQKKLYMVSEITRHEIRNAITGIIGSVDLAYQLPAGTERDQLNRDIKDLALRIQRQIEFTREYEEIGIREPQWHQVRLLIPACEKPRMNISKSLEALEIYADPLITKIFTYLVENVIRHGGTATEIGIRDDGCAGGKFRILFEDNGVGIPADMKKKIFERKIGDIQGMGLFVVREILQITGITMTETGTPGRGARFEILVPEEGFRFRKTD